MALFDVVGKALEVPVYALLGGKVRDEIVLSRSVFMDEPSRMADSATAFVEDGFTCVKVKVGRGSAQDWAAVSAVREAVGPDILLRVDANMAWPTPKDAIRAIRALEPAGLHSVEQPLPRGHTEALRLVREAVATPIMADESVWGPQDAWALLWAGAADLLNVYVAESGGLTNSSLIFRMAELAGVPCVVGAMPEPGIGTAAAVHLAAAMPNLGAPCDAAGAMYQVTDIVNERFVVSRGRTRPSPAAGLGVTLDEDAVHRYRRDRVP